MLKSLRNSSRGLWRILTERMFLIELSFGVAIVSLTWIWGDFTLFDRLVVLTFVFLVLCFEGINTALEKLLDFISPEYRKEVGVIKDMLAGVVLIGIIGAFVVGIVVLLRVIDIIP